MTKNEIMGKTLSYQELIEAIEQFKRAHPQLEDAMHIFNLSNDQYQTALAALYGPRISWSSSTNDTVPVHSPHPRWQMRRVFRWGRNENQAGRIPSPKPLDTIGCSTSC